MSLADLATSGPPPARRGPLCALAAIRTRLPDDTERQALQRLLDDPHGWPARPLAVALTEQTGVRVGAQAIQRHRRGECACAR